MSIGPHLFVNDDGTVGHCGRLGPDQCESCIAGEPPTSRDEALKQSRDRTAAQNAADWGRWVARQTHITAGQGTGGGGDPRS